MSIEFIDYINKEADYKPRCGRCGYTTQVWALNDDLWVCKDCLTKDELVMVVDRVEKALLG